MTRRRLITRIAVCLALGLVTTVAVAWGFAWTGPPKGNGRSYIYADAESRRMLGLSSVDTTSAIGRSMRRFTWRYPLEMHGHIPIFITEQVPFLDIERAWALSLEALSARERDETMVVTSECAFGWPALAMSFVWDEGSMNPTGVGAIPLERPPAMGGAWPGPPRALPLLPVWHGFAVDTVVFATVWAVPVFGWPLLKSRRRGKRGVCVACGYDLGGNLDAGCPECGGGR